ncbi:hypothetical protein Ddye_001363 [Dipteronia dyeriana]|uniref:Clp ATPase C-terminal domain-containing protein n=1 Tax=Dipteronia dyeriana TaxID=168575 RepID=A0AAD9XNC9_9ROSI|nr:hypothetical protein Ddye_001363 [Dipteronia dyeriana]
MKTGVCDAAVQLLRSLGYDPNNGARPVKQVIQQNVENELAKDMLLFDTEVTAFSNGQLPQQKLVFKRLDADSDISAPENQEALSLRLPKCL